MLTLNQRFTVITPVGDISEAGIELVTLLIARTTLTEDWKALNPQSSLAYLPPLPGNWEWVWIVNKGTHRGTMPKRIASYYFKGYGLKCPDSFLSEIGNIARAHSETQTEYTFDLTDSLDWNRGDFGDPTSCLWSVYAFAREVMQNNGVHGIRFYRQDGTGFARAWLYEIESHLYVIWNGYGLTTLTIARAFSQFLNATYRQIDLENDGEENGPVFINGGTGYLVGSVDRIETIHHYDFGWPVHSTECYACNRRLHDDDSHYGPDDQPYCEDCYYDTFSSCECCDETYYRESLYYVESTEQDVCEHCLEHRFTACESCGDYIPNDDILWHKDNPYCQSCFEDLPQPPEESEEENDD